MMNKKAEIGDWWLLLFVGIVALIFINSYFWFNYVSNEGVISYCEAFISNEHCHIVFDGHGLNGWFYLWLGVIVLEIVFVILLFIKKKRVAESWKKFALKKKFQALGLTLLFYSAIPILWYIKKGVELLIEHREGVIRTIIGLIIVLGILFLVVIWYLINILIAKLIGKEKLRKFKVGQKVKVRKDLVWEKEYDDIEFCRDMKKFRGKKVTIHSYNKKDRITIKEDKNKYGKDYWSEEMFEEKKK